MGIGIKPKSLSSQPVGSSPAPALPPHRAEAEALIKALGGKVHPDLPAIPEKATAKQLQALLPPAMTAILDGAKPVVSQDEATWLLKLAAHPSATQAIHDAIATRVASAPFTPKVESTGVRAFLLGLSPTVATGPLQALVAAAQQAVAPSTSSSTAHQQTVGGKPAAAALQVGVGAPKGGNALSSRLALMTGEKTVKGSGAALAELKKALAEGRIPTSLPMNALEKLGIDRPGGLVLRLDGCKLAGQRVVIRKIVHPTDGPGLEFQFKLRTGEDIRSVEEKIKAAGAGEAPLLREHMSFENGAYVVNTQNYHRVKASYNDVNARMYNSDDQKFSLEIVGDQGAQALRGAVRLRVYGDGASLNANMAEALAIAGLGPVFEDSTTTTQARANQMRALWQRDPKKAQEFAQISIEKLPQAKLDAALQAVGVDPAKAAAMPSREVFPGHFTAVNPAQAEEYKKLGVQYLFAGVGSLESVVKILGGDGLMSTLERYDRGIIVNGASSAEDIKTGGADYVFTRMVTKDAGTTRIDYAFAAGQYQIQIDPQILERTDWFAYASDTYGNTESSSFTDRQYGEDLVKSLVRSSYYGGSSFASDNEVMFHRGISKESFSGILTQSSHAKTALIEALQAAGIDQIGGKPLDEAIKVQTQMIE
jgi:hypothetical protein